MTLKNSMMTAVLALVIGGISWALYSGKGTAETTAPEIAVATSSPGVYMDTPGLEYGFVDAASSTQSAKPSISAPSLDYPLVAPPGFSANDESSAITNLKRIIAKLKETPENAALWAQLGFYRKGVEDYKGAREALEYSLTLNPLNAVATDNLGVVYAYYLPDPLKAEAYFLKALALEPDASFRYLRLFELYKYLLKDEVKANAILERGLKAIPGEPSLKALLST